MKCNDLDRAKQPCAHYIPDDNPQRPGKCSQPDHYVCIEAIHAGKYPVMSHSSRNDWCSCRLKYWYHKVMGISTKDHKVSEPIKAGKIWDWYIENRYKSDDTDFVWYADLLQLADFNMAKLMALAKAFEMLELRIDPVNLLGCQYKFEFDNKMGYIDRAYTDHIVETKLSGRPDFYKKISNIAPQVGTYLLSNPDYQHVIMEIVRMPTLRPAKDEQLDAFYDRVYKDVIARPSYYFLGFDRKARTFGIKYHRNEFDLDEIRAIYDMVSKDIELCLKHDLWYPNRAVCYSPGPCFYLAICETGNVSEITYNTKGEK